MATDYDTPRKTDDDVDQDSDSLEVEEFYDRLQLIALDREFALR